jgi:hypothetical protein
VRLEYLTIDHIDAAVTDLAAGEVDEVKAEVVNRKLMFTSSSTRQS